MNKYVLIAAAAIGALCVGLVAFPTLSGLFFGHQGGMQRPAVPVEIVAVQPGPWLPSIDAVGTARAAQGADLAAEESGTVKAIAFKANDRVNAGQLLIQIDDAIERADLQAAEANARLYSSQLARSSQLLAKGFVSQASMDNVRAQLDAANGARARAKAAIDHKAINAPFAGTVGIARVDVGQYVNQGAVLVTLQDLDKIKIDFTVPELSAVNVHIDQPARFGIDATAMPFTGRIVGIDPKTDPASRLVAVQALIENANGQIRPGQFLRVRVDLPTESAVIALPQTAVIPSLYGDYVFLAAKPEPQPAPQGAAPAGAQAAPAPDAAALAARQVFVTTGRRDGERVEIVKGLKAGDQVVTSGQNRLQNGAPVTIAEPIKPASNAAAGGAAQ